MPSDNELKQIWLDEDEFNVNSAVDALLKAPNGRTFLWWLLQIGRVGGQPYVGNALQTAFNCGELNIGQRILDRIISVSPEGYVNMMKEQQDVERTRSEQLAKSRPRTESGEYAGTDSGE